MYAREDSRNGFCWSLSQVASFGAKAMDLLEKSCHSLQTTSVDFTCPTVKKPWLPFNLMQFRKGRNNITT